MSARAAHATPFEQLRIEQSGAPSQPVKHVHVEVASHRPCPLQLLLQMLASMAAIDATLATSTRTLESMLQMPGPSYEI
jgi:hypothetical protein